MTPRTPRMSPRGSVFSRVADFAAEETGGLPTAVGEKDGSHGGAESEREVDGKWLVEKRVKRNLRWAAKKEAEKFEHPNRRDGGERHGGLHAAAGAYAEAIDGGE